MGKRTFADLGKPASFSEKLERFRTEEDFSMAEIFKELASEATLINKAMKKYKLGSLIKTSSDTGQRLDRLQKGDKKGVQDVIRDALEKGEEQELSPADLETEIKAKIQEPHRRP